MVATLGSRMTKKKEDVQPKAADRDAVERDYRTGRWTDRELGTKHGIAHTTIKRWADKFGWRKDLTDAVRQATNAAVIAETVKAKAGDAVVQQVDTVLAAAEIGKQVILRHRQDILDVRTLAMELLGEIRLATHSPQELESLFRLATQGMEAEDIAAVQQSFKDLLKLHGRVNSLHKLADTLNKLQPLERKAFNLDEPADEGGAASRQLSDLDLANRLAYFVDIGRQRAAAAKEEGAA